MKTSARPNRAAATRRRRQDILDAALESFTEVGYARTTIDSIRRRAGASIGSLYHHFATKEEIAAALYLEGIRQTHTYRLAALARARSAEEGVKAFVTSYLRWVRANPTLAGYLLNMRRAEFMVPAEDNLAEVNREFVAALRAWFEPYRRRGDLPAMPADLFAAVTTGPSESFARQWLGGVTRSGLGRAASLFADLAWHAVATWAPTDPKSPRSGGGT